MKAIVVTFFILILANIANGQSVAGTVLEDATGMPLEYVSIGVMNTVYGTITDEMGRFTLTLKAVSDHDTVRVSMIGYHARKFPLSSLVNRENLVKLDREAVRLPEIVIKPSGVFRKCGTTNFTWHGEVCGWGGTDFGKGYEIGLTIDLGNLPVSLQSLGVRLAKQSFDSSFFRLHIREIENNLPGRELLARNIILCFTAESGWVETDLRRYNLVFRGEIAVTLEWVKVSGTDNRKMKKMNGSACATEVVLFSEKKGRGCAFTRWGTEAKWTRHDESSPSFYLEIEQ